MNGLTASIKKISSIIKKNIDIVDRMGAVVYSSDSRRVDLTLGDFEHGISLPVDEKHRLYVYIEEGSLEEIKLVQMILEKEVSGSDIGNYRQFLINVVDGMDDPERYCKKFGIPYDANYIAYCINLPKAEHFHDACSLIFNSFFGENNIWVFPYKEDIILLEKINEYSKSCDARASMLKDMINSEIYTHVYIGVGDIHNKIINIKYSISEAKEAIRIGRMFNIPENIFIYKNILAERIISFIPEENINEYTSGIFNDNNDTMDGEMIKTIEIFFKNDLNITDSARALYIHRNTLIYRLDKIQKLTGLDIRKFNDAVIFKLCYLLKLRRKQ